MARVSLCITCALEWEFSWEYYGNGVAFELMEMGII